MGDVYAGNGAGIGRHGVMHGYGQSGKVREAIRRKKSTVRCFTVLFLPFTRPMPLL